MWEYKYNLMLDNLMESIETFVWNVIFIMTIAAACILVCKYYGKLLIGLKKLKVHTGFRPRGVVFGKHGFRYVYSPTNDEGHAAILSRTGGGKTRSILIPTIRAWEGNGYYIDISGDIVKNIEKENMVVFEPLAPHTVPYDVFGLIDLLPTRIAKIEALCTLAYTMIPEDARDDTSKYYERTGREFLQACFITYYLKGMSFLQICDHVVSHSIEETLSEIASTNEPEAIPKIVQFSGLKSAQLANIYDAPHQVLEIFRSPSIRHAFECEAKNFFIKADAVEKYNVFFVLPDDKKVQYTLVLRLITAQILEYISARELYQGEKILIAIDEFGSFGKLSVQEPLEKYRKRGCRVMLLFQSISQLDANYSMNEREVIFDNIQYTVCLGTTGIKSQQFLADLIGKRLVKKRSYSKYGGQSVNEVERYPIEPYKFGKCFSRLYLISNNEYIKLRKNFI